MMSATMPMTAVDDYAETLVAPALSTVDGVAQVQVQGQAKFAVHVELDPSMLVNRGIGLDDVQNAVGAHNANLPTGTLWGAHQAYTVQAEGQLNDADAYRPIIIAYRNGSPVRLSDLGKVVDSIENEKNIGWFDRDRAITLQVMRQPGTITVDIVDRIKEQLPQLRQQIPPAVESGDLLRSLGIDSGIGQRRQVYPAAGGSPGDSGDLRVPAERFRDGYSQLGVTFVDRGHIRGYVGAGLQHR